MIEKRGKMIEIKKSEIDTEEMYEVLCSVVAFSYLKHISPVFNTTESLYDSRKVLRGNTLTSYVTEEALLLDRLHYALNKAPKQTDRDVEKAFHTHIKNLKEDHNLDMDSLDECVDCELSNLTKKYVKYSDYESLDHVVSELVNSKIKEKDKKWGRKPRSRS